MRKIAILVILLDLFVASIFVGYLQAQAEDKAEESAPTTTWICQYPDRYNEDGTCDNSDPCDPTTLKDPILRGDCADSVSEPEAPVVETKQTTGGCDEL